MNIDTQESPQYQPIYKNKKRFHKALLINDTTFWYHWGCSCTSLALRNELQTKNNSVKSIPINQLSQIAPPPVDTKLLKDDSFFTNFCYENEELTASINDANKIIINGEGSLHGNNHLSIGLLYLAWIAKTRFNKPVHIINHSCYPDDSPTKTGSPRELFYQMIYSKLDTVAVREPVSYRLLKSLDTEPVLSFDCLPLFIRRYQNHINKEHKNRVLIAGSVAWSQKMVQVVSNTIISLTDQSFDVGIIFGVNAFPAGDDYHFISQLYKSLPEKIHLIHATSELDWLSKISASRLLISGRFHHSIAAAFLHTPFITLDSNTPKIHGLMEDLELPLEIHISNIKDPDILNKTAKRILKNPEHYMLKEKVHNHLIKRASRNFANV